MKLLNLATPVSLFVADLIYQVQNKIILYLHCWTESIYIGIILRKKIIYIAL